MLIPAVVTGKWQWRIAGRSYARRALLIGRAHNDIFDFARFDPGPSITA